MKAARVAFLAEVVFLGLWLVAERLAGASLREDTVSDLVRGARPVITTAFALHAVSLGALALCVPSRLVKAGLWTSAGGMVLVAMFPTDAPGWRHQAHVAGAAAAFSGIAVAAGTWTLRQEGWQRAVGGSAVVVFAGLVASLPLGWFPVVERLQLLANGAWILVAATEARAFSTPARSARP